MMASDTDSETVSVKARVEAVLFITSKPMTVRDIAETTGAPGDEVEEALMTLLHEYACRPDGALEISDEEDGYILQVKESLLPLVYRLLPMELSQAATRTLSAIALKAPLLQTELIQWRGSGAYEHLQELLKHQLIAKKRQGRSYMIDVTAKFRQYFKLQHHLPELQLKALLAQAQTDEDGVVTSS